MRARAIVTCVVAAGLLAGCQWPWAKQPAAQAPPASAAPPSSEAPVPAPATATPTKVEAKQGVDPQAALTGLLITPAEGLQVLQPEGWSKADTAAGGPLFRLQRSAPLGGVLATLTLTAQERDDLRHPLDSEALGQAYAQALGSQLGTTGGRVTSNKRGTLAGLPAAVAWVDLEQDGKPARAKQWLALDGQKVYLLTGVGAREEFEATLEPELNSIASTLQLP